MTTRRLLIVSWVSFFHLYGFSQSLPADTLFIAKARQNEAALYSRAMVAQSHIFNGTEYRDYRPIKDEHPLFFVDWVDGSVFYDGEVYENIPLLYDLSTDNLITEHYSSRQKIELIDSKIESFRLQKYHFVHLRDDRLRKGFYELVYDGTTKVYMRRQKALQQSLAGTEIRRTFEEKELYYIFKQGNYYSVKNKKSVLGVLKEQKSELNKFIGKNHIRFKQNREKSIAQVAEYYDSINK